MLTVIDEYTRECLDGSHQLVEIIRGVKFKDGEKLIERAA
jgi:hypothetical protein